MNTTQRNDLDRRSAHLVKGKPWHFARSRCFLAGLLAGLLVAGWAAGGTERYGEASGFVGGVRGAYRTLLKGFHYTAASVHDSSSQGSSSVRNLGLGQQIETRLCQDKRLDAAGIIVEVEEDGTAVLRGLVSSPAHKDTAVRLVRDTRGVERVVDHLAVPPRPASSTPPRVTRSGPGMRATPSPRNKSSAGTFPARHPTTRGPRRASAMPMGPGRNRPARPLLQATDGVMKESTCKAAPGLGPPLRGRRPSSAADEGPLRAGRPGRRPGIQDPGTPSTPGPGGEGGPNCRPHPQPVARGRPSAPRPAAGASCCPTRRPRRASDRLG